MSASRSGLSRLRRVTPEGARIPPCPEGRGLLRRSWVKAIKGRSSRVLREEFPYLKSRLPTLWTNSYFVATVGGAPLAVVKRYVEQQKGR